MRIALVRLTSLGDIILAMASLQIIRRAMPECEITWVADTRFADILDHQPDIRQVVRVDLKGLKHRRPLLPALYSEYRSLAALGDFDVVIDLHGMIKSAAIAAILGGRKFGFAGGMRKESLAGLFYSQTLPVAVEQPAVCRYASLVAGSLGLDFQQSRITPPEPYLFWGTADEAVVDRFFSKERRNILFVPGTSADYKNYPPERFARLANLLRENILICHGNKQEEQTAIQISAKTAYASVLPSLSLNQLKAAIGRADLVIGGDTGPTHMAWACGIPSITLFGATPVCICPTQFNRVIKTGSEVNYRKPDAKDCSVGCIPEEDILFHARELLG